MVAQWVMLMCKETAAMIAQTDDAAVSLNAGGWVMMCFSILLVCGISAFCMYRIFREPSPSGHHHAPLDINTHDTNG